MRGCHPIRDRAAALVRFVRAITDCYRDCHLSRGAAATAYYLLLSLFPMAICVSLLLYRHLRTASLWYEALAWFDRVLDAIGGSWGPSDTDTSSVLFFAALTLLLSASAGAFRCLYLSASDIDGLYAPASITAMTAAKRLSGFFGAVIGYLFATLLFFSVYAAVFLLLLWEELTELIAHSMAVGALTELLFASRYLVMVLLFLCLCIGLLRILPPNMHAHHGMRGDRRYTVIPGAVFCTVGLSAATAFFALIIRTGTKYSLVYGSLASMILFLMWLFVCANVLLLGVAVNALVHRMHGTQSSPFRRN